MPKWLDVNEAHRIAQSVFSEDMSLAQIDELAFQRRAQLNCTIEKKKSHFMIVIPYRDRKSDLLTFLLYMPAYFCFQEAKMDILVVEQVAGGPFNKGKLFNVAIREMDKINTTQNTRDRLFGYNCFSFHDIDKLPIESDSPYVCLSGPHNLIRVRVVNDRRIRTYQNFLGGVTMFTRDQLEQMNGASNSYLDWGGEDDDMWNRAMMAKLEVFRPPYKKGRFIEFNFHHKRVKNPLRFKILRATNHKHIMMRDGLRQVEYKVLQRRDYKTFVWLQVAL
ncbi:hypothetical protein Aperf_G00000005242 [Anoplocephala perfoliata]